MNISSIVVKTLPKFIDEVARNLKYLEDFAKTFDNTPFHQNEK